MPNSTMGQCMHLSDYVRPCYDTTVGEDHAQFDAGDAIPTF
jgi:hypothetical protein